MSLFHSSTSTALVVTSSLFTISKPFGGGFPASAPSFPFGSLSSSASEYRFTSVSAYNVFLELVLSSGLISKGTWILQASLSLYSDTFSLNGCRKIPLFSVQNTSAVQPPRHLATPPTPGLLSAPWSPSLLHHHPSPPPSKPRQLYIF
ncbi:hypothetical protein NE237_001247 [Protea cynaroides]|uniref:Uncharacterized protein n=1 Tax=Protea cynaroides TaxID=273540 RepID=A0A9Q0KTL8_9MAGN|nr:hypothetical protein NE237_001247 [Protea cynaroides]